MRNQVLAAAGIGLAILTAGCGDDGARPPVNHPPELQGIVAIPDVVAREGTSQLTALAGDRDDDPLTFSWSAPAGEFTNQVGARIRWKAPAEAGSYRISVVVSDGEASDSASTSVAVGSGAIIVESTPPGASILLDGVSTGSVTPDTLMNLATVTYVVEVSSAYFIYSPAETLITLGDGDVARTRFAVPRVRIEQVIMGPSRVDFIGGLTYASGGSGVLYAAETGGVGRLHTATLVPSQSGANGRVLLEDVDVQESLSLRTLPGRRSELAFVVGTGVRIGNLVDPELDGLVEEMSPVAPLGGVLSDTYGPSFSQDGGKLAFGLDPSTPPNHNDILLSGDFDSTMVAGLKRVSGRLGNAVHYGPRNRVVFESGGEIFAAEVDSLIPAPAVKLTDTGGNARSPAYSPDGRYVVYIDARGRLELLAPVAGITTSLLFDVTSPKVAWAPHGRELLIADNSRPGDARLFLVFGLPIR